MKTEDRLSIACIGVLAIVAITMITMIGWMTLKLIDNSAKREREEAYHKAACLELQPKYSEIFVPKQGFYKDYAMIAISASEESVVLKSYEGPVRFWCSEIERQK